MPLNPDRILFEDESLLVVTKLSGELSVQGRGKLEKLPLFDFLQKEYPTLHVIHRLDFETSGVIVFAKSRAVLQCILSTTFAGWKKTYYALTLGVPSPRTGNITIPLEARSGGSLVNTHTHYTTLESFHDAALVECTIERGQRHQIRRHLSMIGTPLLLDEVYGNPKMNRAFSKFSHARRFFLHAYHVEFPHPVTHVPVQLTSPYPSTFQRTLELLRSTSS